AVKRAHDGLRAHLKTTPSDQRTRAGAFDLLTLSPVGLKQDHPTPAGYRRRLTFLAHVTARALLSPHNGPATEAPSMA
ncbi:MAG: hypothetical protein ACM3MM_04920, partial [Acidobacteriota bacterium]